MKSNNVPHRIYLSEDQIPRQWYNLRADMKEQPDPMLNPATMRPVTEADLRPVFCDELAHQELDAVTRYVDIPEEIREFYKMYRPSPLIRAYSLERALGTPAKIYYKFEGNNTSGSHKLNSAIAQAYYAKEQGLTGVTTETGAGQWGTALSMACAYLGLDCHVFMVKCSYEQKPFRREVMRTYGADVTPSPSLTTEVGRKILAEFPDTTGSLGCAISEAVECAASTPNTRYVLGSVLNQVLLHQSVIGLETKAALDKYGIKPDIIIGCAGGGSNLGGLIAREIGDELGIPSYIVDPVVIDEMTDVARYAGHPLFQRVSIFHALNQKAVAKRFAKEQGKKYEDLNLIVCHMGGGVSIGAHMKGSVVDTQNALDGEGPFSPERSGSLPTGQLVKQCFSGKYTESEMHRMLSGRGGLVAYTGSNDMRYLLAQAEHDKKIAGVVDAFHYQIGKEIGAMAAVMHGKVDQIILTGGIAYGKETVDAISEMVGWIAPITVYPGEDELLALAQGALRVLKGEEKAQEYRRPRPEDNN